MNSGINIPRKIAVIGPTQSGKTCLAVGLFSTSTSGFTIDVPQIVERNYLNDRSKGIVSGTWPASNNKGAVQGIRLDFHKKHRPDVKVEIADFAGELLADDETFKKLANVHFRDLDGVVLLVNPGADAFQGENAALLEDAKTQYNRILSFLHDPNNNSKDAFIALTVTAADRILGKGADLRGKDGAFRDCLEGIENSLSSMNFKWKKFYVSMSGRTGEGNTFTRKSVPKGWPNTTSRPFLWILDRLGWQSIVWNVVLRFLKIAGFVALFLTAIVAIGCYFASEYVHQDIEQLFKDGKTICDGGGTTAKELKKAFDKAKKKLESLEEYSSGCFYKEYAKEQQEALAPRVAEVHCRWIERKLQDISNAVDKLAGQHGDNILDELLEHYRDMENIDPPQDLAQKRSEVSRNLDKRVADEFEKLMDQKSSNGLSETDAQEEFETLAERMNNWNPITEEGNKRKEVLQNELPNKQIDAVQTWNDDQQAFCNNWITQEITNQPNRPLAGQRGLFTKYKIFQIDFQRDYPGENENNPNFTRVQRKVYEKVEKAFQDDVKWFENSGGGKSAFWEAKKNFAVNWTSVIDKYSSFKQLCREVADDPKPLQTSWAWQFATLCNNQGNINHFDTAFPQTIIIDKVVASVDYHKNLPYLYKYTSFAVRLRQTKFNDDGTPRVVTWIAILPFSKNGVNALDSNKYAVTASEKSNEQKQLFTGPKKILVHAFEEVALEAVATDYNKNWIHPSSPIVETPLAWGETYIGFKFIDLSFDLKRLSGDSKPKLELTVHYHVEEGKSMRGLMEEAKMVAKSLDGE